MKEKDLNMTIESVKDCRFPVGVCCANRCADCRYMEMDNDHYNDGTRRCSYKGRWLPPSTPACPNFKW